jgi:predicted HicB family RNase H-like nuclease
MIFDPESYTISIRKENHDGEILYVGRVAEFPNISSFEDSFEEARALVIDAIQTLKKIADETQTQFPAPYPIQSDEFSGRITLRLPKTLHAKISRQAAQEDVSVNQYLVTAIATYAGEADGIAKVVSEATSMLSHVVNHAVTHAVTTVTSWASTRFLKNISTTPEYLSLPSDPQKSYLTSDYLQLTGATQ